ncbi:MAG: hypothetical protein ACLTAC_12635 [Hungatella sp.]
MLVDLGNGAKKCHRPLLFRIPLTDQDICQKYPAGTRLLQGCYPRLPPWTFELKRQWSDGFRHTIVKFDRFAASEPDWSHYNLRSDRPALFAACRRNLCLPEQLGRKNPPRYYLRQRSDRRVIIGQATWRTAYQLALLTHREMG